MVDEHSYVSQLVIREDYLDLFSWRLVMDIYLRLDDDSNSLIYLLERSMLSPLMFYLIQKLENLLAQKLVEPSMIFEKGQCLFYESKVSKTDILCLLADINLLQLSMKEKEEYIEQLKKLHGYAHQSSYYICQYDEKNVLVVLLIHEQQLSKLIGQVTKSIWNKDPFMTILKSNSTMGIENFHQLLSHTFHHYRQIKINGTNIQTNEGVERYYVEHSNMTII